ncbi:Dioxygenase andA [Hondaea fermentalgiana]|uniref:Dioxygenase andA n=1 Tax=Hondaea fermentalgiana TaxID=2315210 RepID=A0A2R5GA40_9STRA|nr:Dioxygenase andA [Hondaea fermentalgiana]|eukprot:GBG27886.1 Dioxygenase andA [Hondaea fermentalgiana]
MAATRYQWAAEKADPAGLAARIEASLDTHGYAIVEGFLDEERVAAMKAEITGILNSVPEGRNDFEGFKTRRMYAVFGKTRSFDDLATHPLVLDVVERGLESDEFLLSSPTGIEIHPGEVEQMVHRDDGKYPIDKLAVQDVIMNSMWALDDFTEENGSTVLFPGTHKLDKKTQKEMLAESPCKLKKISATMPKGSVMFYRGSLLHGGGANRSDKARLGVILEYCSGWVRPQENHFLAVPRETVKTLPDRLQELLGYSVASPFIGYVDGRHPKKSLL